MVRSNRIFYIFVLAGLALLAIWQLTQALSVQAQSGSEGARIFGVENDTSAVFIATDNAHLLTQRYQTVPAFLPPITVTTATTPTPDSYIFLSNFRWLDFNNSDPFHMILDNDGELVYYKQFPTGQFSLDFRKQPNGLLTYYDAVTRDYKVMDDSYTIIDTIQAGNGYEIDNHGIQMLPNGHVLLYIYDEQPVDMSQVVDGGNPNALVTGLVIQELDTTKNVVFEWQSWDHFAITDTVVDLTTPAVDYVHANSIELDSDGHLIISSRHMDEVTKINRQTGEIMWRLGGKNNEFTLVGDTEWFDHQHDARRLPNGNLMLFDNRTNLSPRYSRVVEYELDEVNKIATLVWEYRHPDDYFARAMGNAQRLENGNTMIGWGSALTATVSEVTQAGDIVWEMGMAQPNVSYRTFRYEWDGLPVAPPTLVSDNNGEDVTLHFSWNGATAVAGYEIYANTMPTTTTLISSVVKTGFEDSFTVPDGADSLMYYWVKPIDAEGNPMAQSNQIYTGRLFLPRLEN